MSFLFEHECDEWDGLRINEQDIEFACCTCNFGPLNLQALMYREARNRDLDWMNRNQDLL